MVKDIQAHLRHTKADTAANEYMLELPESVKRIVGEVYTEPMLCACVATMLTKGGESQESFERLPQKAANASEQVTVNI
ncbi:MAG TPA: hypothetical protein VGY94_08575 [Acidobacteriaceae bacterium]|jgi:hypothetical protein|nr:hypothetical protein [Acidobacteriaceae bacterium]